MEEMEKVACQCSRRSSVSPAERSRSRRKKQKKAKKIMGRKIPVIKNILLGVYKTEKCYDSISRPYVRDRLG